MGLPMGFLRIALLLLTDRMGLLKDCLVILKGFHRIAKLWPGQKDCFRIALGCKGVA